MERYRVFGRTAYPEPLEFQGTVTAAGDDAAATAVLERHGRRWVELVLIPERSITWILGPSRVDRPEGSGEPQGPGGSGGPRGGPPEGRAPVDQEVDGG